MIVTVIGVLLGVALLLCFINFLMGRPGFRRLEKEDKDARLSGVLEPPARSIGNPLDLQFWPLEKSLFASAVWRFDGSEKPTIDFQVTNLCPGELNVCVSRVVAQQVDAYGIHPVHVFIERIEITLRGVLETQTLHSFLYSDALPALVQVWVDIEVTRNDGVTVKGRMFAETAIPTADITWFFDQNRTILVDDGTFGFPGATH